MDGVCNYIVVESHSWKSALGFDFHQFAIKFLEIRRLWEIPYHGRELKKKYRVQ
jgi:hypothetical protein